MKKIVYMALLATFFFVSCNDNTNDPNNDKENKFDSTVVSLGANQIYDVFYNLKNGEIAKLERSTWDIAIEANTFSATLRINDGAGIQLFSAGGIDNWNNVDATMASEENQLFNSPTDWSTGAFNANSDLQNWSYGWGTYIASGQEQHSVIGDSVFIVKFADESLKKIAIIKRDGVSHDYQMKWADLDGSNLVEKTIATDPYVDQHFIYYSLKEDKMVTEKVPLEGWDILFTQYTEHIEMSPGNIVPYPVTGVLINPAAKVAKVQDVPVEEAVYTDSENGFSEEANSIGYDWKSFNRETNQYEIAKELSYFVLNADSVLYQIYFTGYTGTSIGEISFKTKLIE